jgi:hypothetical protein
MNCKPEIDQALSLIMLAAQSAKEPTAAQVESARAIGCDPLGAAMDVIWGQLGVLDALRKIEAVPERMLRYIPTEEARDVER